EKRSRISLLDLKDQREGEAHIFFKSNVIRAKLFHADPPKIKELRLNHFLKVDKPVMKELVELEKRISRFQKVVKKNSYFAQTKIDTTDMETVAKVLLENKLLEPIERGVSALVAYHSEKTASDETGSLSVAELLETPEGEINIFANLAM